MPDTGGTGDPTDKLDWIGQTLGKLVDSITRQALTWSRGGNGKEDDREEVKTWRYDLEADVKETR